MRKKTLAVFFRVQAKDFLKVQHPVKSLAEFAPAGDEKIQIIFHRDMCVAENTTQAASVRVVRRRRTAGAWSRL